jgi:hypothetical protein
MLGSAALCIAVGGTIRSEAGSFEAPAITRPANGQHLVGKIVWRDLETTDLARAKKFYAAVFGWEVRSYHLRGADYAVAVDGGRLIGGMLQRAVQKRRGAQVCMAAFHLGSRRRRRLCDRTQKSCAIGVGSARPVITRPSGTTYRSRRRSFCSRSFL